MLNLLVHHLTSRLYKINLSISMLFRILHTLSILTGPNIFLNICLSKIRRLFSSFAVKVQASDQYVTTGLIIVLHIFNLVSFFRSFGFIRFELHQSHSHSNLPLYNGQRFSSSFDMDVFRNTPYLTLKRLMSYIYGAPILDVSRSHTTTQHSP